MLAEKLRRRASAMTLPNYIELMRQAAAELDAEAAMLEEDKPVPPGIHVNIVV